MDTQWVAVPNHPATSGVVPGTDSQLSSALEAHIRSEQKNTFTSHDP
jgi:hypothetical protein